MNEKKAEVPAKFYINANNRTILICPKCGEPHEVDVSNFIGIKNKLKVKCVCGSIFKCSIEFRLYYRKNVKLPGDFRCLSTGFKGQVLVNNISMSGIQFAYFESHRIRVGDTLELNYLLDDRKRTKLRFSVQVKWTNNNRVGVKIREAHHCPKDLGFYMLKSAKQINPEVLLQ